MAAKPDGLLRNETIVWGLLPPHLGMRQYWRDFDSLERWTKARARLDGERATPAPFVEEDLYRT